jgi:hypothetical protein
MENLNTEYWEAVGKFCRGCELPIDKRLQVSITRIKQSIQCAKKEGAKASAFEILILCGDEAKNIECDAVYTLFKHCQKTAVEKASYIG